MKIIVAVTGATGTVLAKRLLEALKEQGIETHLVISDATKKVMEYEKVVLEADFVYDEDQIDGAIASSSFKVDAMVVVPCSMKTLSAIANGFTDNLIVRAADNILKMNKKFVVVPRETPLSLAAIENMKKLKMAGAIILPPNVSYYHDPETVQDMTDFVVGKILDCFDIENNLYRRWGHETKRLYA